MPCKEHWAQDCCTQHGVTCLCTSLCLQFRDSGVYDQIHPFCSPFKENKAIPFYSSFILKLNVYEMCICSSEYLSTKSSCNDPLERVGGLLGPQSPLQTACPGDGGCELGLLWGCRQEPVSLHGLLSPGLDVCAMDNQQLWRALLGLLQIPRASALPSGTFFPLSLFKTPFGCSTYFHTVSIIPAPPSPPPLKAKPSPIKMG